jgi:hypothetical protein
MFRVVPPIIKSANNWQVAVTAGQIPDTVHTIICAPHYGWWYHPKHVEQFPDKINCVTLHLVRYILEYNSFTLVIKISLAYTQHRDKSSSCYYAKIIVCKVIFKNIM